MEHSLQIGRSYGNGPNFNLAWLVELISIFEYYYFMFNAFYHLCIIVKSVALFWLQDEDKVHVELWEIVVHFVPWN